MEYSTWVDAVGQTGAIVAGTSNSFASVVTRHRHTDWNETDRERLAAVLQEVQELLQEYAPSWYTEELHERVEAALRAHKKL